MIPFNVGGAALVALIASGVLATSSNAAPPPGAAEYASSWAEFQALRAKAHGGQKKTFADLPDWSGIWEREVIPGYPFDPNQPKGGPATAVLTPEFQARYEKKVADAKRGVEWDNLSYCLPAGMPRWLTEPRLREFIVRPETVWLTTEQQSEVRRVYTDGRGHVPDDEAFPLWEGDSIGFWDGDTLVVHTKNMRAGQYQRRQPDYTDQVSTVERIRKIDAQTIEDIVTVYDPPALVKPWRVVNHYIKVDEGAQKDLRINMWSCNENNNVVKDESGTTNFILPGEAGYKNPSTLGRPPVQ